jgi:hypothetical protein
MVCADSPRSERRQASSAGVVAPDGWGRGTQNEMMQHDPYTPPKAPIGEPARAPGSPWKAVLAGLAIDIGGTLVAGIVLAALYGFSLAGDGASDSQIADALGKLAPGSWVYMAATVAGAGCSLLGGYACARIARRSEYRLGFILAGLSCLFGLVAGSEDPSTLQGILPYLTTIACVLLGAKFGRAANAG